MPPPESSKSRHSKQLKPPDESFTSSATNSSSIENTVKTKAKVSTDDSEWLSPKDVMKLGKTNQTTTDENRNGLKLSTSTASDGITAAEENLLQPTTVAATTSSTSSSAAHYIDAFSDLDPLGTGKIRPYIDKKYFFQDLKNPPKKVLKDLSDRDGFSTAFLSDSKNANDFSLFNEKSTHDNTMQKTVQDMRKQSEQSDEFIVQFSSSSQIFSPNNNGTHGTPPNLSRSSDNSMIFFFINCLAIVNRCTYEFHFHIQIVQPYANQGGSFHAAYDTHTKIEEAVDPFSPRVNKFDPFEEKFSKANTFDFSFNKGTKTSNCVTI